METKKAPHPIHKNAKINVNYYEKDSNYWNFAHTLSYFSRPKSHDLTLPFPSSPFLYLARFFVPVSVYLIRKQSRL